MFKIEKWLLFGSFWSSDWDILLTWSFMLLRVMWRRLLRGCGVQATLYMTSSWEWQLCRGPGSPMVSSWSLSHEHFWHDFIFRFSIVMTMIWISEYPMLKLFYSLDHLWSGQGMPDTETGSGGSCLQPVWPEPGWSILDLLRSFTHRIIKKMQKIH